MKATLLKRLDALAGSLLTRLFWRPRGAQVDVPPESVLFIRPGGIGDAVLLIPALRVLQTAYPGCRIDILAEKRNAAAFILCPGINRVHRYDSPSGLAAVLCGGYDVVVDTEQWYRLSAIIARSVRAPRSIGFAVNERKRLFTHPVSYSQEEYEAYSFFRLLRPLGIDPPKELPIPFLALPAAAVHVARKLLAPLHGKPFVAMFPGASIPEKEWGPDNFRGVASALAEAGIAVVLVGGKDSRGAGDRIAEGGVALNLAGKGSLPESSALIGEARVLVSGDSGLLHIAAGLGTSTVSIFGPSDPGKWSPKGERHQAFGSSLPCAPCSRFGTVTPCTAESHCMGATVSQVAAAVMRLWAV